MPTDLQHGARSSPALTPDERDLLDFEGQWQRHVGAKEEAIRGQLGLTPARYYQLLDRLVDTVAAQAYDPMLTRRIRSVRDRNLSAGQR